MHGPAQGMVEAAAMFIFLGACIRSISLTVLTAQLSAQMLAKRETVHSLLLSESAPLEPTVGDEFQGCFETIADAARASVLARLMLLLEADGSDSRYGLGWGEVTVFSDQRSPISQDGQGWWAARASIERADGLSRSPRTAFIRTCFTSWDEHLAASGGCGAAIEAFLVSRDAAIDRMSDRQLRLLLGTLMGQGQRELAEGEGITQSAVSQTLARSGASAIKLAHRRLEAESA